MRKNLLLTLVFLFGLMVVNSTGQNVIIVTDNAPDSQLYADQLVILGYTVQVRTDFGVEPSPDQIAELNAADLVIISRTTNSANYNYPAIWNNIETPILMQSCFLTRNSRLMWMNSAAQLEGDGVEINVIDKTHPIFKDIDVSSGTLGVNSTVAFHVNPITDAGNGKILATTSASGNVVIAEWPKDTEFYTGAGYFATDYRAVFFTGGTYDFSEDGLKLWLNMIHYILNPLPVSVKTKLNDRFKIYPLPAGNAIKIEGDLSPDANFEIISLSGQVLISSKMPANRLVNTSGLRSGVYLLKMSSNNQVSTLKIVKK